MSETELNFEKKETFLKLELLDGINAYYLAKPPKKLTKLVIL